VKLTIVAATGGIGRHLLQQALDAGHDVTAAVRNPGRLPHDVPVATVDLAAPDQATLETAVAGADAVLSGLGPRSASETGVAERGTRALADAMAAVGGRRLVVVSAAPVSTLPSPGRPHPPRKDPGEGFVMRRLATPMIKRVLRTHYADLARMEDVLRAGDLDWTVVRPPRLTDGSLVGTYRTAHEQNLRRGWRISRADVAHCMLALLDRRETVRRALGVAY
jgi:putative NADH-flavin reductase